MNTETPKRSNSLWLFLSAALLAGIGLVAVLVYTSGRAATLPKLGKVPDAQFTAQNGQPFRLAELTGSVWVGDLIFTTCSGPCLRMTSQLYRVQENLKRETGVRLVSISVDPARDTPERLTWYAGQAQADPAAWLFLTAGLETVRPLAIEGLKLVVENDASGQEQGILHSDRFVLVDANLQIRGYYDGLDPASVDALMRDIRTLLKST
jgi:protein SCO1/2